MNKIELLEEVKDWVKIAASAETVIDDPRGDEEWTGARKDLQEAEANIELLNFKLNVVRLLDNIEAANMAIQYALLGNPKKNNFTEQDRETVEAAVKLLKSGTILIRSFE